MCLSTAAGGLQLLQAQIQDLPRLAVPHHYKARRGAVSDAVSMQTESSCEPNSNLHKKAFFAMMFAH